VLLGVANWGLQSVGSMGTIVSPDSDLLGVVFSKYNIKLARAVHSNFGISKETILELWYKIWELFQDGSRCPEFKPQLPIHLLWALRFLRVYTTEDQSISYWKVDRTTLRTWVHRMCLLISVVLPDVSFLCK